MKILFAIVALSLTAQITTIVSADETCDSPCQFYREEDRRAEIRRAEEAARHRAIAAERTDEVLRGIAGKRLTFHQSDSASPAS